MRPIQNPLFIREAVQTSDELFDAIQIFPSFNPLFIREAVQTLFYRI